MAISAYFRAAAGVNAANNAGEYRKALDGWPAKSFPTK
jgi:hypothetical protein